MEKERGQERAYARGGLVGTWCGSDMKCLQRRRLLVLAVPVVPEGFLFNQLLRC
jgi:hypothetical protein